RLAPGLGQARSEQPRDDVGPAARRKGDDDSDRLRRKRLSECRSQRERYKDGKNNFHDDLISCNTGLRYERNASGFSLIGKWPRPRMIVTFAPGMRAAAASVSRGDA